MADTVTTYLGLKLRNPIIVGSSGLTDSAAKIQDLEKKGAGAVVVKSIFEEEILLEYKKLAEEGALAGQSFEALDYLDLEVRAERLDAYMKLISDARKRVSIPVIASINCTYSHEWVSFARALQSAGADALELNVFFLPSDPRRTSEEIEKSYFDIVERVKSQVSLPVALKIGYHFSALGSMIQRLSQSGVAGLVLFNRFWAPDLDIDKLKVMPSRAISSPDEYTIPLRWIAIMAKRVQCDLAASTGIHDGKAVIKQLLAGAKAVQVISALYKNGTDHIQTMLDEVTDWMTTHEFYAVEQFRGSLSQAESADPAVYERVQFMTYGSR
jgi:dihydroorotate dehydrogenase (fumarate)